MLSTPFVQEIGHRRTGLGGAVYIKIYTEDKRQLCWTEVWSTFVDRYPDQWAVQAFPPTSEVVDDANIYHLFVLDEVPAGLNINRR